MIYLFKKIINFVLTLLSPPFCEYCRTFLEQRTILCQACFQKIKPVAVYDLKVTAKYKIPVYAIGAYQEPLKSLVLAKMRSYRLISEFLGELIYTRTPFQHFKADFIVPVPLHFTRVWRRGYNQSLVMAERLQQLQPTMMVADILKRTRATKYQSNLGKLARLQNLQRAFSLKNFDHKLYRDKHLILIDDVFTSGATLAAACQELLKLKPKSIVIIVCARAI